jgi:hypothetical protein
MGQDLRDQEGAVIIPITLPLKMIPSRFKHAFSRRRCCNRFAKRSHEGFALIKLLAVLAILGTLADLRILANDLDLTAKTYWNLSEQRAGQPGQLSVRLECPVAPGIPLTIRLAAPDGVKAVSGEITPQTIQPADWSRGNLVANSIEDYWAFRVKPEKRFSATVTWRLTADKPLATSGQVQVETSEANPLTVPVRFDFRPAPEGLASGIIPVPKPTKDDLLVGALYYPGWQIGEGSGWSVLDPYPERRPALGYHEGDDPAVASWEIKWAAENGIDFFFYCWYLLPGQEPTVENLFLGDSLHKGFLGSSFADSFQFAILWENDPARGDSSPEFFRGKLVPFWMKNYFLRPNYAKLDGKPIFGIYDMAAMVKAHGSTEAAAESIRFLRDAAKEAGLPGIWILGEERYPGVNAARSNLAKRLGLDAIFPYCFAPPRAMENAEALAAIKSWFAKLEKDNPLPVVPTATVSWDPQPWVEYIDYRWHSIPFWLDPPHFGKLVAHMKSILEARDKSASPLARRLLLLDNWNEYAEGHWIAPSRKQGFGYLNAVRDAVAPDAPKHPNILPEDVGLKPDESAFEKWFGQFPVSTPP